MTHKLWQYVLAPYLLVSLCLLSVQSLMGIMNVSSHVVYAKNDSPHVLGDYAGEIREARPRKDGIRHVDTPRMIRKLKKLGINTYTYLVWHAPTDWDDLRREFLPAAKHAGINVLVYLVPPSESRVNQSEPFGTDYVAWFRAIGRLSQSYPNLKGVVMDDFNHNLSFFSPDYVRKMRRAGRAFNPNLKFYPQIYYSAIQPDLLQRYRSLFDGLVMTFRDGRYRNTQRLDQMEKQIQNASSLLKKNGLPLILMIHASKLSATPSNPSVSYIQKSMGIGLKHLRKGTIQGLITYALQKEWFSERKDRRAYSGFGYGCLFVPRTPFHAKGKRGEIRQQIHLDPSRTKRYSLQFQHMSVYPRNLKSGQYIKQVLIDDHIVWEEDVQRSQPEKWKKEQLNLTPYLTGKKKAVLTLRLLQKNKGSTNSWLFIGFDHLETTGFQLENTDFEKESGWDYQSNHPAILGQTLIFDPNRRLRIYLIAMTMFTVYHLYDEVIKYDHPSLNKEAEKLFQAVTDQQHQHASRSLQCLMSQLEQKSFKRSDSIRKIQDHTQKLERLFMVNP